MQPLSQSLGSISQGTKYIVRQDTSSSNRHAADMFVDLPTLRIQACTGLCQAYM